MHDLKEAGFTDKQSEVQARRLELVIADVKSELKQDIKQGLHVDELIRKQDVDFAIEAIKRDFGLSIEKLRYEMLKFTALWTGVAVVMAIAGILAIENNEEEWLLDFGALAVPFLAKGHTLCRALYVVTEVIMISSCFFRK